VVKQRYDIGAAAVTYNTPVDLEVPCWVQTADNGLCALFIRQIADASTDPNKAVCEAGGSTTSACAPIVSAIRIEPDTGGARITVAGITTDITISQTRQFTCVGWFIASTCSWAIVSGPGSIDANGLYTAPSITPSGPETVTIRATSTVDGMLTADAVFDFVFGSIVVTGTASSIYRGQTSTFSAAIGGVSYANVTWSRSGSQGSINSSGVYTAPATISPDDTITITATSTDDGTKTGTANLDIGQTKPPVYINATIYPFSGNTFTDGSSRVWVNDGTVPGLTVSPGTIASNVPFMTTITEGTGCDASVTDMKYTYLTFRYDYSTEPAWGYTLAVPNGLYRVRLKFFTPAAVSYTQTISLEGVAWLSSYDTLAATGGANHCADEETTVTVADGALNILFAPAGGATLISGVIVTDLGPGGQAVGVTGKVSVSGKVVVP